MKIYEIIMMEGIFNTIGPVMYFTLSAEKIKKSIDKIGQMYKYVSVKERPLERNLFDPDNFTLEKVIYLKNLDESEIIVDTRVIK